MIVDLDKIKLCANCGKIKTISQFCRSDKQNDGYTKFCRACCEIRSKQNWRDKRNPDTDEDTMPKALKKLGVL